MKNNGLDKKIYPRKNWYLWGNRYLLVRMSEVFSLSGAEYWKNFYGIDFNDHLYVFDGSQTGCYFLLSKFKCLKKFYLNRIKKCSSVLQFYTKAAEIEFDHYIHAAHFFSVGNLKSLKNNQILKRYNSFIIAERRATAHFWFIFEIDHIFSSLIQDIANRYYKRLNLSKTKVLNSLSQPLRPTAVWQEYIDRLILQKRKIEKKLTLRSLQNHATCYGWFPLYNLDEKSWTARDVQKLIDESMKNLTSINKELKGLHSDLEERKKIIAKLKIASRANPNDYKIISWAPIISYYREYRNDIRRKGIYYIKPLYQEIARRFNLSLSELIFLDSNEIASLLKGKKIDLKVIEQRKFGFSCGTIKGKWFILNYPIFSKMNLGNKKINIIKGMPACTGKVIGKVFLISRPEIDLNKFSQGNILVTSMTSPAFVPAIQKSKAVITDEGGLTSHAAIVAREFKKPCIVGTKVATKMLKNGDLVEVDAVAGIVRLLKN